MSVRDLYVKYLAVNLHPVALSLAIASVQPCAIPENSPAWGGLIRSSASQPWASLHEWPWRIPQRNGQSVFYDLRICRVPCHGHRFTGHTKQQEMVMQSGHGATPKWFMFPRLFWDDSRGAIFVNTFAMQRLKFSQCLVSARLITDQMFTNNHDQRS